MSKRGMVDDMVYFNEREGRLIDWLNLLTAQIWIKIDDMSYVKERDGSYADAVIGINNNV